MKEYEVTFTVSFTCCKSIVAKNLEDAMMQVSKFDNNEVDILEHPNLNINNENVEVEHIEIIDLSLKESA